MPEPAVAAASVGPGSILGGKYRLDRVLGSGAMGTVYAAVHEKLGREVAIKVLNAELGQHQEAMARFQREAELVTRLGHPNIVAVYDFGLSPSGAPYFVMEVVTGETLRKRLERGPLSDDEVVSLFAPLLSAVGAAHAAGVVHRDLKPENVMLVPRGDGESPIPQVKLLDFGVAKIRSDDRPENTDGFDAQKLSTLATAVGAMMGTPAYMSPEQIKASPNIDGRADIYAVGVMLFEAVTGQRPFIGDSLASLLGAHLLESAEKPSQIAKRLKLGKRFVDMARLDRVILRTLAKLPEERYADCQSLRDDLDVVWGGRGLWKEASVGQAVTTRPVRLRASRRGLWAWLVPLVLLAGLAVGIVMQTRHHRHVSPYKAGSPPARALDVLQAAERGSPSDKRALLQAIDAVPKRSLLPILTELVADETVPLRPLLATAYVIGQAGDVDLLAAVSKRTQSAVGAQAVDAQAVRLRLGAADAVAVLDSAAASETLPPDARLWAGLALTQAGKAPKVALQKLKEKLWRPSLSVPRMLRQQLLLELVQKGDETTEKQLREQAAASPLSETALDALELLALAGKTDAQKDLHELLAKKPPLPLRPLVVLALARAGDVGMVDELKPLLSQDTYRLRAVAAAGRQGPKEQSLTDPLLPLLSSSDAVLQKTAAASLLALAEKESHVRGD